MVELLGGLSGLVLAVFVLWFALWIYILLPARMAERRNRSRLIWVLISLCFSPVLAILLLLALGEA